jgi:hypothetical protein
MSIGKLIAGAAANVLSFAHLSSVAGAQVLAAVDDDKDDPKEKMDGESDEDYAKRMKADADKPVEQDKSDGDAAAQAAAVAASTEALMAAARAEGAATERARCAAIFASAGAAKQPTVAANFAFKTSLSAEEAVSVLDSMPSAAVAPSASRAARNPDIGGGGDASVPRQAVIQQSWDEARAKVSPQR